MPTYATARSMIGALKELYSVDETVSDAYFRLTCSDIELLIHDLERPDAKLAAKILAAKKAGERSLYTGNGAWPNLVYSSNPLLKLIK